MTGQAETLTDVGDELLFDWQEELATKNAYCLIRVLSNPNVIESEPINKLMNSVWDLLNRQPAYRLEVKDVNDPEYQRKYGDDDKPIHVLVVPKGFWEIEQMGDVKLIWWMKEFVTAASRFRDRGSDRYVNSRLDNYYKAMKRAGVSPLGLVNMIFTCDMDRK